MKVLLSVPGIVILVWLGLWAANIGLLVGSSDTKILKTRECSYFVGVSVLKRLEPLADRCPLIRSIGT